MEDVIALVNALEEEDFNLSEALPNYQAERQPAVQKLAQAALNSAKWYESFAEHMDLSPWKFACSYIARTGRINSEKIRMISPIFAAAIADRGLDIEST